MLAGELGLEPGAELRRLESAVLAQDPALDWQPASGAAPAPPLERVTGLDPEHLLLDLEPAIAAGLVAAAEAGWGFRFRHPLIHESLYAGVGRLERARLRARVAAALEDTSSASVADVVQLAHHYL